MPRAPHDLDSGPRRLAAGDWVVVARPSPSVPGLGKIVDGEHDPEDDALLRAKVELASATAWFAAGDLGRVSPEEEVALARSALERGLVPEAHATPLGERLAMFADGRASFVRSPGLLDRMWALVPEAPGLARWFDEGTASLSPDVRRPRVPASDSGAGSLAEATRPPSPFPVIALRAIVERIPCVDLARLVVESGAELPTWASRRSLVLRVLARSPSIVPLLRLLPPAHSAALARTLGAVDPNDLAAFAHAVAASLPRADLAAAPTAAPPDPVSSPAADIAAIVSSLNRRGRKRLGQALELCGPLKGDDLANAIIAAIPDVSALVSRLRRHELVTMADKLDDRGAPVPRELLLRALEPSP